MSITKFLVAAGVGLTATAVGLIARFATRNSGGKVQPPEEPPSQTLRDQSQPGRALTARRGPFTATQRATMGRSVYVRDGLLHGPGGATVEILHRDLLWLGRALTGEVGTWGRTAAQLREQRAAVVWALAQNLMLVVGSGNRRPRYDSLAEIALAYCQPINPRWASIDAPGCAQHPEACTSERLERRRQVRALSWEALPEGTREVLEDFADGNLPNPVPGLVDWHANGYEGEVLTLGGNHFGVLPGRRLVVSSS